jgi:hypothetical protein
MKKVAMTASSNMFPTDVLNLSKCSAFAVEEIHLIYNIFLAKLNTTFRSDVWLILPRELEFELHMR